MAIKVRKRREEESPDGDDEQTGDSLAPAGGDPFMRGSMRTLSWFSENQNTVLIALVIVALTGVGVYVGMRYSHQQAVAASEGVSGALLAVEAPVQGSPVFQAMNSAENAAPPDDTFSSEEEKWTAIYEQAGTTLEEHDGSTVAQLARVTRASAAVRLGKAEEAVTLYQEYLDRKRDSVSAPIVQFGLSVAHAEKGNYKEATEALDAMIEADSDYESVALYHKGMYLEKSGDVEGAKEAYNKVLETDSESPYKTEIERRLALL